MRRLKRIFVQSCGTICCAFVITHAWVFYAVTTKWTWLGGLGRRGNAPSALKADYIKMFEYVISQEAQINAPDVFYWPSSPSSGGSFDDPNARIGEMSIIGTYGIE